MKYLSRWLLCAALIFAPAAATFAQDSPLPPKPSRKPLNTPGQDLDFRPYLSSPGRFSVVTFYADWCPACRSWSPMLDAINSHFPDMQVLFMDIDDWGSPVAEQYGVGSIPYFMIYDSSGTLLARGKEAQGWLREAIESRARAARRGTYRLGGVTGAVDVGPAGDKTTAKGTGGRKAGPRAAGPRGESPVSPRPEGLVNSGPLPSVDEIIARYVGEIGGGAALKRLVTRKVQGKIEIPSVGSGKFESEAKAPNKVIVTMDLPSRGVLRQWFDGAAGWSQLGRERARRLDGIELAALSRDADFYGPLRLKQNYPRMKTLGVAKLGYREAYVVEAKPAAGDAELMYFSKESGLLIRQDVVRPTPRGKVAAEVYLDDWRMIDGVRMPFRMTQAFPGLTMVFTLVEVRHGEPVNDAAFGRPPAR